MGGAVSTGIDNDDLIDNLVDANYIKSGNVERVFRAVDRAEYYLPEHRDTAYRDLAWKHGHLHLSAPCIYSEVMESLRLKAGLSFLNLGSGTGYLSTMVGLMIGPYAVNHGVELHPDVVEYARERLEEFKRHCEVFDEFEFSEPVFVTGNCLLLTADCQRYDRVYCGAACPPEHEDYMKKLINVGGILVMPLNDQLLQITRSSENTWESKNVLPVSFASLVMPSRDTGLDIVELPEVALPCLQDACRVNIRRILKVAVRLEHPPVKRNRLRKPKGKRRRQKRINIVPMSMGMVILGQFDGSDEDAQGRESDEDNGEEVTESEGEEAMDSTASSVSSHQHGSEDHSVSPQSLSVRRSSPRSAKLAESQASSLPFPPDMQEKVMDTEGSAECEDSEERAVKVPRSRQTDGDRLGRRSRHQPADSGHDSSSEDSDHGQFDLDIVEMIRRSALATRGPPRKVRCSSSTSADTSETSGICTVSDHSDESIGKPSPETCSPPNLLASLPPPTTSQTLPDRVNSEPNFKFYLKEKISALPIPVALKAYLMYYRN